MIDRLGSSLVRALGFGAFLLFVAPPAALGQGLDPGAVAVLETLVAQAPNHGLAEPGDEALRARLRSSEPEMQAAAREQLRSRVVRYAQHQHAGRASPSAVDARWAYRPAAYDAEEALALALAQGRVADWARSLAPGHAGYQALVAARGRYAALAAAGGWETLAPGAAMKPGAVGPQVAALRRRLAVEGYATAAGPGDHFDAGLKAALEAFQQAHGLNPDGVLGPESREALNVPANQRLQQIDLSLERWRWLPRALPARRIDVNVAAAEAAFIDGGGEVLRMRIVVGDLAHKTPLFSSAVHSVVFNPPWNVPASIAQNEILPRARRDPGYLARNRFSYVNGQLRQAPGAGNSLGRIKLDFDSPFGVYLHDTPGKAAFARSRRTLSHGCMRLEKPFELAALLLAPQGWSAAGVEEAIAAGSTRRVGVSTQTPIFVVYQTAWVQSDGRVAFRADAYGWDAKLASALGARPIAAAGGPRLESECANARES